MQGGLGVDQHWAVRKRQRQHAAVACPFHVDIKVLKPGFDLVLNRIKHSSAQSAEFIVVHTISKRLGFL